MKSTSRPGGPVYFSAVIALGSLLLVSFVPAAAQRKQGNNAICNSNACTQISDLTGSSAFIDASMFSGKSTNFCGVLGYILNTSNGVLTSAGGVIDARGLPGTTTTTMACTSSPWAGITSPPGSVILLPAGTITTSASWVLPQNTKLIGTAKGTGNIGTTNYAFETTIQASANFSGAVVQFGDSSHCSSGCQGISVEHLTISGNGGAGYTMNGL
jgi:hypothetical protein